MIGGAVRVIAAMTIAGGGSSMAKALHVVEAAKAKADEANAPRPEPVRPPWDTDAEARARRLAARLSMSPSAAQVGLPAEARQAIINALVSFIVGGLLNRAATVLGRR